MADSRQIANTAWNQGAGQPKNTTVPIFSENSHSKQAQSYCSLSMLGLQPNPDELSSDDAAAAQPYVFP